MCVRHALAWSESNLCRDIAQHNSGASSLALSAWVSVTQTEAAQAYRALRDDGLSTGDYCAAVVAPGCAPTAPPVCTG
jgi:hypothetical protein